MSLLKLGGWDGLHVTFKIRDFFFEIDKVTKQVKDKRLAFLNRVGSFVRIVARRSMRKAGRYAMPSSPGNPPKTRSSDPIATLRNILYGYDSSTGGVVVGPVMLGQRQLGAHGLGSMTVPQIHEYGGTIMIQEEARADGKPWYHQAAVNSRGKPVAGPGRDVYWRRRDMRFNPKDWKRYRQRPANYPARPFMAPAVQKAHDKWPQLMFGHIGESEAA